jgi:O-antigen/teichoic acid export membrane protein
MMSANLLQGVNRGIVPVVVLAIPQVTVLQAVTTMGAVWCVVSSATIAIALWRRPPPSWALPALWKTAVELGRYGLPRVPGEFALGALLTLPAIFAVHFNGIEMAGFIAVGVSILNMVGSLFSPVGQIVLPTAAALAASGSLAVLRRDTARLFVISLLFSTALVGIFLGFAPVIVTGYLGSEFAAAVPAVRWIAFAAVPFVAYVVLRNVLDAVRVRPINTRNLVVALCTFVALALVTRSPTFVPVAFTVAIFVLGGLSAWDCTRVLRDSH